MVLPLATKDDKGKLPLFPGVLPIQPPHISHLSLPGTIAPPVTPMAEIVPQLPGLSPLPIVPPGLPEIAFLPDLPKLPRVPTLPEVSLIPGMPNIPLLPDMHLLPQPQALQGAVHGLGQLGAGLAPLNVAGMFRNSRAHLTTLPEIKYIDKRVLQYIKKLPLVKDKFLCNAVVLLPIPKKHFIPPSLPHGAIPGFMTLDAIIHGFISGVLWHMIPGPVRRFLEPAKVMASQALDMVSLLTRSWQVHWHRTCHATHLLS
jgi:hypothetical protein